MSLARRPSPRSDARTSCRSTVHIAKGATRHAIEISAAFDTLSQAGRRELSDRHGKVAVRERSPGASPPPTPWRIAKHEPRPISRPLHRHLVPVRERRSWRMPTLAIFCLGIMAGLTLAIWLLHERDVASTVTPPLRMQRVLCHPTSLGAGYEYPAPIGTTPQCRNGAPPAVLRP